MGRRIGTKRMRAALLEQADSLAELMVGCGCRSAMVRTFVDDAGRVIAACNLYSSKGKSGMGATSPVIEFREEL